MATSHRQNSLGQLSPVETGRVYLVPRRVGLRLEQQQRGAILKDGDRAFVDGIEVQLPAEVNGCEVARLKLRSMEIEIGALTAEQASICAPGAKARRSGFQ